MSSDYVSRLEVPRLKISRMRLWLLLIVILYNGRSSLSADNREVRLECESSNTSNLLSDCMVSPISKKEEELCGDSCLYSALGAESAPAKSALSRATKSLRSDTTQADKINRRSKRSSKNFKMRENLGILFEIKKDDKDNEGWSVFKWG